MNALILLLLTLLAGDSPIDAVQRQDIARRFDAKTIYGDLTIDVQSPIVYLPKGKPVRIADFIGTGLSRNGKPVKEVNQFFAWDPKPVELKLVPSSTVKLEKHDKYTFSVFGEVGPAICSIALGDETISVPITVKSIDYEIGQEASAIIKDLGFADQIDQFFVKWPESKSFEGLFYTVSASESIRKIEQWRYNRIPHCVFSIEDQKIVGIDSVCVNDFDRGQFPIAFQRRVDAEQSEADKAMPAEHDLEALEASIRENEEKLKRLQNPVLTEEFMLKDGTYISANWLEFKGGKHRFEDADGKVFEHVNSELSTKALNRIKDIRKMRETKKKKPGK